MSTDPPASRGHDPSPTAVVTTTPTLTSADGEGVAAWHALPARHSATGVVVIPDLRGLGDFATRLVTRLADQGYPSIAFDLYTRTAGISQRPASFPYQEHIPHVTRAGMQADLLAAIMHLRTDPGGGCQTVYAVGLGGVGGRLAFLAAAARFGLAGVVGFCGVPGQVAPFGPGPTQHAGELASPVLAHFGGADEGIPPREIDAFDTALTTAGVDHEIVIYPGAPHGFFEFEHEGSTQASADAWRHTLDFLARRPD